jgi:hypothetical protein
MTRFLPLSIFRSAAFGILFAAILIAGVSPVVTNAQRGAIMGPQARTPRFMPPIAIGRPAAPVHRSQHLTYLPAMRRPMPVLRRATQGQTHFVSTKNHHHFSRHAFRFNSGFGIPTNGFFPSTIAYWPWWGWESNVQDSCRSYDENGNCYDQQDSGDGPLESSRDAQRPMIIVYLRDGSGYGALDYWVTNGMLYIATTYGAQKIFPMEQVDLERTGKENAQRGVSFTFYDHPMISDPGPVLAPDSYAPPCPAVSSQASQGQSTSAGNGQEWFGATGSASEKGLAVSSVRAGSPAEQIGLQAGDVVVRVDCQPIRNAQEVDSAFAGSSGTVWISYLIQGAWMTDKKIVR